MSGLPDDAPMPLKQTVYLYLAGVFITALLIGDTIGSKLFVLQLPVIGEATVSCGAMWFPITFVLTDVINEFYGVRGARSITFVGFWMALLAFSIIWLARQIPAASFSPIPQETFDVVFGGANRIFLASMVAYLIGQMLDITLFHAIKKATGQRFIWARSTGSTLVSQLVDTFVVTTIAFWGVFPADVLLKMAAVNYLLKIVIAVVLTPVIYGLHALLHRRLGLDEAVAGR
ncbi:MAG: queuosine precursor transporter [Archangiaceae bacterium]|nr:queuosine precursor transporter [Archangiaceae bacterium]